MRWDQEPCTDAGATIRWPVGPAAGEPEWRAGNVDAGTGSNLEGAR